ncbi:Alcohol dehydrogenase, C-terminal [Artemisia annua]|uniref:Alcohol dehydrogenase, C-terminal n=1 Tax=Artemisia annua TaxID=35608 RepID=A0A2U1QHC9_ARTAN|nr:Alcohol dehydrogenase, C-terminal [Artemisia annua]
MDLVNMKHSVPEVITCKAAVIHELGGPVIVEEITVDPPKASEARIKMLCSSICHTDILCRKGFPLVVYLVLTTLLPWQPLFPRIPGHEGVGMVESIGEDTETTLKIGDIVIPLYLGECGQCSNCKTGKSNLCHIYPVDFNSGLMNDGTSRMSIAATGERIYHLFSCSTWSEYMVIDVNYVLKIDPKMCLPHASLLSCGFTTGFGAPWKEAQVSKGSLVVVFGLGVVGLGVPSKTFTCSTYISLAIKKYILSKYGAIKGAQMQGASKIIGVDINENKAAKGKVFGMTDFINPKDHPNKSVSDLVKDITDGLGVDYSFECTGVPSLLNEALEASKIVRSILSITFTDLVDQRLPVPLLGIKKVLTSILILAIKCINTKPELRPTMYDVSHKVVVICDMPESDNIVGVTRYRQMDQISSGSVCDGFPPLSSKYPWLVAQSLEDEENNTKDPFFYTIHNDLPHYRCRIPELLGERIRGSFHGWVILSNHPNNNKWSLWNQETSKIICLPTLILEDGGYESIGECCLSAPPSDPSSILLLTRTNKPTFVFFQLVSKRKKFRWTEMSYAYQLKRLTNDGELVNNLTCCNGKVYALNTDGTFAKFVIHVDIMVKDKEVVIKLMLFGASPFSPRTYPGEGRIDFLKGSSTELFYIRIYFEKEDKKTPTDVYLYKSDLTRIDWEERECLKYWNLADINYKDVPKDDLEGLDRSQESWEEIDDLKDAIFFLDLARDHSVSYKHVDKHVIASDFGGFIHIRGGMGESIYSYHVKNDTISLFPIPSPMLPTSHLSMWECRCFIMEDKKTPTDVYLYKSDLTRIDWEERECLKYWNLADINYKDVPKDDLEGLDRSQESWEEIDDLKDAIFFLDLARDHSVSYKHVDKHVIASDFGGFIHIRGGMGESIYSYHVKNDTISLFPIPSPMLPTSHLSMWECRLEDDHGEAKYVTDSEVEMEDTDEVLLRSGMDDGVKFNESQLLNMPFDILKTIIEHCVGVEYMNFRAACKQCHLAAPLIKWSHKTSIMRLQWYSFVSPWLMVVDRKRGTITCTDPLSGDNYFMKNPFVETDDGQLAPIVDGQLYCSRFGWLLFESRELNCLVFYNPFTDDIRDDLPDVENCLKSFCFSAPPTSQVPMIVLLLDLQDEDIGVLTSYLYTLCTGGELIVFSNLGKEDSSWKLVEAEAPKGGCKSPAQYFLTNCDQHLLLVSVGEYGGRVEVFKRTESKQEWEKIDSVGRLMDQIYSGSVYDRFTPLSSKYPWLVAQSLEDEEYNTKDLFSTPYITTCLIIDVESLSCSRNVSEDVSTVG